MTIKELLELGLSQELAEKVLGKYENMIPKSRLDETISERDNLKTQLAERNKQLEELSKSNANNEELKKQIAELQTFNTTKEKEYQENITKIKLDNALELALTGVGSRNNKAVRALLNMENIKLDNDKLFGFDEQIVDLKKNNDFLFKSEENPKPSGVNPANPSGGRVETKVTLGSALAGIYGK